MKKLLKLMKKRTKSRRRRLNKNSKSRMRWLLTLKRYVSIIYYIMVMIMTALSLPMIIYMIKTHWFCNSDKILLSYISYYLLIYIVDAINEID
jgi:sterol desaturase/sphingolipid hydroxylase (fatty acid hydroxylase superfamily)